VVHAWCEHIEWIDDWTADDEALGAIARAKAPGMPSDQIAALVADFREWLAADPIRSALSRDAFPSEPDTLVRVENELPFARRVGDEIQEGFIDRLVLIESGGQVVRAEILDFKTDAIEAGDEALLADRTDHYRPQIQAYCDVIREQYRLSEGDVAGKLIFLTAGVVREVV
jgi:ATP-dependent exoDNAse (exonuclease V) beta subunit